MCRVFIFKDTGVRPHLSVGLTSVRQKGGRLPRPTLELRRGYEAGPLDPPFKLDLRSLRGHGYATSDLTSCPP